MLQTYNTFPGLPELSRVWIYSADRELSDEEIAISKNELNKFIANWATHGTDLGASSDIIEKRFVVIVVDEMKVRASGCSIDTSVHFLKDLGKKLGVDFFNRMKLYIHEDNQIKQIHLSDLVRYKDAILYDPMIANLKEFRTEWIIPVQQSILYKQFQ